MSAGSYAEIFYTGATGYETAIRCYLAEHPRPGLLLVLPAADRPREQRERRGDAGQKQLPGF